FPLRPFRSRLPRILEIQESYNPLFLIPDCQAIGGSSLRPAVRQCAVHVAVRRDDCRNGATKSLVYVPAEDRLEPLTELTQFASARFLVQLCLDRRAGVVGPIVRR